VTVTARGRRTAISVDGHANRVTAKLVGGFEVDGRRNRVEASRVGDLDVDRGGSTVDVQDVTRELDVQGTENQVRFGGGPCVDLEDGKSRPSSLTPASG
jgi:hypothetical protein